MIFPARLTVKSATSPLTLCKASALFCAISWLAFSFKRPASSLASAKISALLFSAVPFAFSIIVLASVRLPANSASRLLASSSAFYGLPRHHQYLKKSFQHVHQDAGNISPSVFFH